MLYTEKEKTEIERVRKGVCRDISSRSTAYELVMVGQGRLCLAGDMAIDPLYVDTGRLDRVRCRSLL